jgi:hypothetical protein
VRGAIVILAMAMVPCLLVFQFLSGTKETICLKARLYDDITHAEYYSVASSSSISSSSSNVTIEEEEESAATIPTTAGLGLGLGLVLVNDTFSYAGRTYTYQYYRPKTTAKTKSSKRFLFGVVSDPCKPERRQAIRDTWAKLGGGGGGGGGKDDHRVVYIIAYENENNMISSSQKKKCDLRVVQEEFHEMQDMIVVRAREHYREGLTRKTMAFLHYGHTYGSDYVFKTDDDVYVNVTQMKMELLSRPPIGAKQQQQQQQQQQETPSIIPNYYYGWECDGKPVREGQHRFYISKEEFAPDKFPPYAAGFGYALHKSFVACVMEQMPTASFMPWEDAAVGILAETCNVTLVGANPYWTQFQRYSDWEKFPYSKYKDGGTHISIVHGLRPEYFLLFKYHLPLPPPPPSKH